MIDQQMQQQPAPMGALSENQIKQDTDAKMTPVNDTSNAPAQGSTGPAASGDSTQNAW